MYTGWQERKYYFYFIYNYSLGQQNLFFIDHCMPSTISVSEDTKMIKNSS